MKPCQAREHHHGGTVQVKPIDAEIGLPSMGHDRLTGVTTANPSRAAKYMPQNHAVERYREGCQITQATVLGAWFYGLGHKTMACNWQNLEHHRKQEF